MTELTETQDTIENESSTIEGEFQEASHKTRIFNNLSALTDYINTFKINNGQFAQGVLRNTGKTVYQLTYVSES